MADRIVRVRLSAEVASYVKGMEEAARKTREAGSEAEKLAQQREAFQTLGSAAAGAGAAISLGVSMAIAKYAEFDQQMSYVQAATHETAENMDLLRDAAMDAGARTVYSASEAAAAIEELAKAGVSTADILGGALDGAMDAAAAGGMEVAATAELMASTLSQFNLKGGEASHVADLLAAGAGKAQGDMADLGQALNQAGLVSNQFGLSIEDTVGTLAAFANAGMLGSDAGTSLRTMLLRLANPTGEVKELMQELGIAAYDSQGDFVGLDNLAGQLQRSLGDMTQAQRDQSLAMIFGQDAIRGANILMNEGTEGIREWTRAVDDQGYAQETAAQRLDNLKGDWEAFSGALDTLMISMGEGADGPLRAFVQGLTDLVDEFNDLPDWAKQTTLLVAGIGGAILTVGGLALLAIPKIAEFKTALQILSTTSTTTRGRLSSLSSFLTGPWGIALAGAALGVTALQEVLDAIRPSSEEMQNAIVNAADAMDIWEKATSGEEPRLWTDLTDDLERMPELLDASIDQWQNLWKRLPGMGYNVTETGAFATTLRDLGAQLKETAEVNAPAAADAFKMLAEETDGTHRQQWALLAMMPDYKDALYDQATAAGILLGSEDELATQEALLKLAMGETNDELSNAEDATARAEVATAEYEEAVAAAEEALDALKDAIREYTTEAYGVQEAHDNLNRAINDSVEALTGFVENGGNAQEAMYGTSNAGIGLRDVMAEIDQNARDSAVAILENGGTVEEATQAYNTGRDRIVAMLGEMGVAPEEAQAWADKMYGPTGEVAAQLQGVADAANNIPAEKYVNVYANTDPAVQALEQLVYGTSYNIPVYVQVEQLGQMAKADGGLVEHTPYGPVETFANGGVRPGIYRGGANIIKFAEPETIWEAYVSGKPSERERNVGVWVGAGSRLGVWDDLRDVLGAGGAQSPVIGNLTLQSSGDFREDVREVNFQLRALQRGGRR